MLPFFIFFFIHPDQTRRDEWEKKNSVWLNRPIRWYINTGDTASRAHGHKSTKSADVSPRGESTGNTKEMENMWSKTHTHTLYYIFPPTSIIVPCLFVQSHARLLPAVNTGAWIGDFFWLVVFNSYASSPSDFNWKKVVDLSQQLCFLEPVTTCCKKTLYRLSASWWITNLTRIWTFLHFYGCWRAVVFLIVV